MDKSKKRNDLITDSPERRKRSLSDIERVQKCIRWVFQSFRNWRKNLEPYIR